MMSPSTSTARHHGFTMVEVLITVAIIGILADIIVLAVNPLYQIAKAYNVQRTHNLSSILDGFMEYAVEHSGAYQTVSPPPGADCAIPLAPAPPRHLCTAEMTSTTCDFGAPNDGNGCVDMSHVAKLYLADIPQDPNDAKGGYDDLQVDYTIQISQGGKLTAYAIRTQIPPAKEIISLER